MSLEVIKKYKILAKKSLGQNFLVNENITAEISELVDVKWKNIIEVWPGYGALTEETIIPKTEFSSSRRAWRRYDRNTRR